MKLDIGAGNRPYEPDNKEWWHLDERALPHIEYIGPAETLGREWGFAHRFNEIMARHILEHFSYRDTIDILRGWGAIMEPGGKLHIEVPNLGWQAKALVEGHDVNEIVNLMYGDQDYPGNFHKTGFTEESLMNCLQGAGFVHVRTQDIGMVIIADAWKPA